MDKKILDFYKQTSLYTDLGLYTEFAKNLTDDIDELCVLQRKQIIHPIACRSLEIRNLCDWGDLSNISPTRLAFEDDLFPTAIGMLHELLRRDNKYHIDRKSDDKIHVTCRGQAILLASILKAKGYAARVRSGFTSYVRWDNINYDHWITEYYDESKKKMGFGGC